MSKYDDIINLSRPKSSHPKLSIESRAAQFSPFAALTGYDEQVKETARLTKKRIILDEEEKNMLDYILNIISDEIKLNPLITITYFVKDKKKSGGSYITITENIKKIDNIEKIIILKNNKKIPIDDIIYIDREDKK